MKAVFHTDAWPGWGAALGERPGSLASVAGKPFLEYWLEWAVALGVDEAHLVLGDGAAEIEAYVGEGARWGLAVRYGFVRPGAPTRAYLRRSPALWADGLLYVRGPVFPQRLERSVGTVLPAEQAWTFRLRDETVCFLSRAPVRIAAFVNDGADEASAAWADLALDPLYLADIQAYYQLNMRLVGGEIERYVPPGYLNREGAYIGYNVQIAPSAELHPPLSIGNECRIHPLTVIGPRVVIGNRVIVDRQTELADCIVQDGGYVGRNLEIKGKIVSGSRLIEPEDGMTLEIEDPWLVTQLGVRRTLGDLGRAVAGWLTALPLVLVQAVPFVVLYAVIRLRRGGGAYRQAARRVRRQRVARLPLWSGAARPSVWERLFHAFSLDLFPLLIEVLRGRLWLCGHKPLHPEWDPARQQQLQAYFPAAIGYHTRRAPDAPEALDLTEALYYERYRSLAEDARILGRTLLGRLMDGLTGETPGGTAQPN